MEETETGMQEKITAALDGRKQNWLVKKLIEYSDTLPVTELEAKYKLSLYNDVILSRKMNGHEEFQPYELKAISKILKIKL